MRKLLCEQSDHTSGLVTQAMEKQHLLNTALQHMHSDAEVQARRMGDVEARRR